MAAFFDNGSMERGMVMQTYRGKSVFGGVAVGKICVYQKGEQTVKRTKIENAEQEKARFNAAVQESIRQLGELYEKAVKEVGEANAAIFEIHQIMLEDEDYLDAVQNIIDTQKVNAEYAVAVTGDNFAQMFAAMEDEYMRGRAADVKDISERIVRVLSGGAGQGIHTDEPVIILADDLAPSETVQLEKDKVLSFVTVHGSVNSHTAILARTMSIPAHAEAETNTAGSTMGKETTAEDGIATYANVQEGWKQDSKGWWYQYSNGAYPKSTWRQIKGKWYYFNSNGYWVDNNRHETGTIKGIDISEWQGDIDWSAVKNDGYEYAIVRLGYSYRSNNLLKFVKDKKYDQNMKNANAVDIPVGVYLYSKAKTVDEAKAEAQYIINTMQGYQVSYPVVFDLEDPSQSNLGKNQLGAIAKAFCTDIRRAGYTPMLYCNEYWYSSLIDVTQLKNVDKWIARYANTYTETIDRDIWQCCATGRVSGIDGDVDIDFSYKDYTETITPKKYAEVSKWIQDENGWWYRYGNGEYPAGGWEKIKGIWYLFDSDGYLLTGWQKISGKWYYMNENGAMQTGWQKIGGKWYYMNGSGVWIK